MAKPHTSNVTLTLVHHGRPKIPDGVAVLIRVVSLWVDDVLLRRGRIRERVGEHQRVERAPI